MEKLPAATSQPGDQADKKQHDENEKQYLRDTGSPGGDTTKAQQCRDNGDYEKYDGVIQPVSYTHLTLPTNREV